MTSSSSSHGAAKSLEALVKWCTQDALPFWTERGSDPEGGFFERLMPDGSPDYDAQRRVRVQARLLFVFSYAHSLGWIDGTDPCEHLAAYILNNGAIELPNVPNSVGGIVHLLDPDGGVADSHLDTYAQAFGLLGFGWHANTFSDPASASAYEGIWKGLDRFARHPSGGFVESAGAGRPEAPLRRQNPHMHLVESFMALARFEPDGPWSAAAADVLDLFVEHFFDEESGCLIEYFAEDWTRATDADKTIEPGHMMEWAWLLLESLEVPGLERAGADRLRAARTLYTAADAIGRSPVNQLLVDLCDTRGKHIQRSSRSWPQTEAVKAGLALARYAEDGVEASRYLEAAAQDAERLMSHYLDVPTRGGWVDQINDFGRRVEGPIQASTFYHLICAAAEAQRALSTPGLLDLRQAG